jgi:20S proteasome subunit beta 6
MLYSRRGFPYFSFCVVAGLDEQDLEGGGQRFVYNAIGPHEQVAVATAGTGRELLQPILDRKFETLDTTARDGMKSNGVTSTSNLPLPHLLFSSTALLLSKPRTQVAVTWQQAVAILRDAYQSVAEREIGVGDEVVMCVLRKQGTDVECQTLRFSFKRH